jgi:hypothetical protein
MAKRRRSPVRKEADPGKAPWPLDATGHQAYERLFARGRSRGAAAGRFRREAQNP